MNHNLYERGKKWRMIDDYWWEKSIFKPKDVENIKRCIVIQHMKQLFDVDSFKMMMILPQWKKIQGESRKNNCITQIKFVQAKSSEALWSKIRIHN